MTARRGELVVRENETERRRDVGLLLYNAISVAGEERLSERFEGAVEVTAALVRYYLAEGFSVGLATLDGEIQTERGPGQYLSLMQVLALIELKRTDEVLGFPESASRGPRLLVSHTPTPPVALRALDQVIEAFGG